MTNLEVLKASVSGNYTDVQLEVALTKRGLVSTDTYDVKNERRIDLACASLLFFSISYIKLVSELDYSVTAQSVDDIMKAITALYGKWGLKNPYLDNKIKGSNAW